MNKKTNDKWVYYDKSLEKHDKSIRQMANNITDLMDNIDKKIMRKKKNKIINKIIAAIIGVYCLGIFVLFLIFLAKILILAIIK